MPQTEILALARAYNFAAAKHLNQRRKGEAQEPYVNHLTEVAELTARAIDDVDVVIAAVLHDTIEDTDATRAEIAAAFGERVAAMVAEVSDDKSLAKAERKALQVAHAAHASSGAKIIKLADKTSNVRALLASPPRGWSEERLAEYVAWAASVVAACRAASPTLAAEFDKAVDAFRARQPA